MSQNNCIDAFMMHDCNELVDEFKDLFAFHKDSSEETRCALITLLQVCISFKKVSDQERSCSCILLREAPI